MRTMIQNNLATFLKFGKNKNLKSHFSRLFDSADSVRGLISRAFCFIYLFIQERIKSNIQKLQLIRSDSVETSLQQVPVLQHIKTKLHYKKDGQQK